MESSDNPVTAEEYVRTQLDLSSDSIDLEPEILGNIYDALNVALPLQPDHIIQDRGKIYFIEIKKGSVTLDTLARMNLNRDLWQKQPGHPEVRLVLAAKTINKREEDLARDLDIQIIKLPWAVSSPTGQEYKAAGIRISSDKSWRIITRLLREKNTSIRQLAIKENVSYGWTHKVIEILAEQNIVRREGGYVTIADVKNLLNGVAWERPMKNLRAEEFFVNFTGAHMAAQEITRTLREQNIAFAFTGYTAGGLYTSYAFRQDMISLYLEKGAIDQFRENFGSTQENNVRAVIYSPDRDVFAHTQEIESIVIASPSQTLLDLAGLGYSAMDLTMAMVEIYARL
jgi:DNA-binding Lrp family transcriptional regulator